jgi:hypothetical protein
LVHLVDQEQCARTSDACHLADLTHEIAEVLLWIARIGDPRGGLHVELELHASWNRDAERLDHAQRAVHSVLDPHSRTV